MEQEKLESPSANVSFVPGTVVSTGTCAAYMGLDGIVHWRVWQTGSMVGFTLWVMKKAESSLLNCGRTQEDS